ncbi:hypothetical protein COU61_00460 [Candidatus Pacearchaeota archaeon CG10_big_fil_rev_8_21_14_0_10_35_13]|nr:MAG: hypothetical protein COU61_00460 [Candidatus Pacearchaeota archaeon CG10_big_fil_rev_8_21_14_0_10_35_13]
MKHISELSVDDLKDIKLLVFDVDGVIVPRGTKISTSNNILTLETKKVSQEMILLIKKLSELGFLINISSGRSLFMLLEMFREVLPFVSITYENGSASWYKGVIHQHVNSFDKLRAVLSRLSSINHPMIKGFEPKELIVTIHCHDRVSLIEELFSDEPDLYCLWNGEAYDIGIHDSQTKAQGLIHLMKILNLNRDNVLAIGDNYNDKELLEASGLSITCDKSRVSGDFFIELLGDKLPGVVLSEKILSVSSSS